VVFLESKAGTTKAVKPNKGIESYKVQTPCINVDIHLSSNQSLVMERLSVGTGNVRYLRCSQIGIDERVSKCFEPVTGSTEFAVAFQSDNSSVEIGIILRYLFE